jgi:hypothetical protein
VRSLGAILNKLAEAQTSFCRAADAIPSEQWTTKPSDREWSAGELVAHLIMVEREILGGADRITQKTPRRVPFMKRHHLPLWLVEARIIKRRSPIPLDPGLVGAKEEMLGELRAARERTHAFLEETKSRDLGAYCWPHPFLGMLNLYEWFEMIAAHQVRHTKQMREIHQRLPKLVGSAPN